MLIFTFTLLSLIILTPFSTKLYINYRRKMQIKTKWTLLFNYDEPPIDFVLEDVYDRYNKIFILCHNKWIDVIKNHFICNESLKYRKISCNMFCFYININDNDVKNLTVKTLKKYDNDMLGKDDDYVLLQSDRIMLNEKNN